MAKRSTRSRPGLPAAVGAIAALALVVAAFFVHDTSYVLQAPYWNDEAWVVASTLTPLTNLGHVTGPTPLGWTALLRLVFVGGDQRARLLPVLFAGLAAAAAYWLGREMRVGRLASMGMGVVALFCPAMLVRDDLKQYTTEAFVGLAVAALLVRAQRLGTRRALGALTVAVVLALPFANATLFVGSAALLSLAAVALLCRQWRRLRDVLVAGAGTGALWGLWVLLVIEPHQSPALVHYFDAYYPPHSIRGLHGYLVTRVHQLAGPYAGLHSSTLLVVGLLGACIVLAALGQQAVALLPLVAVAEIVLAGLLRLFPVLDQRTSTWLLALVPVLLFGALARAVSGDWIRRRWTSLGAVPVVGGLVVLTLSGTYAYAARSHVRAHPIPAEDARDQAHAVVSGRRPGDVVVVDVGANYAYAFYGGVRSDLHTVPTTISATGYYVDYRDPAVIALHERTPAAVTDAYLAAVARARRSPGAHIWVVRMHQPAAEAAGWKTALAGADVVRDDPDGLVEVAVS